MDLARGMRIIHLTKVVNTQKEVEVVGDDAGAVRGRQ